jgi:hypothetical protein
VSEAYDGLGFEKFALHHGARAASQAALRRLMVADLPPARRRALGVEAAEHARTT